MVSLTWVAGIIVILIGLALLIWSFWDAAVERAGVTTSFIITIIIGVILVIVGSWLAKGGKVAITE